MHRFVSMHTYDSFLLEANGEANLGINCANYESGCLDSSAKTVWTWDKFLRFAYSTRPSSPCMKKCAARVRDCYCTAESNKSKLGNNELLASVNRLLWCFDTGNT